jgi:hypothetical protein
MGMNPKTKSELLFEAFCIHHALPWVPIAPDTTSRPDYRITVGAVDIAAEIKQLDELTGFNQGGVSGRTVGDHVRGAIKSARYQIRWADQSGIPGLLIIYNARDPFQMFGTEEHDFTTAMYGELTVNVSIISGSHSPMFHGRNAKLRTDDNIGFSGIGHLVRSVNGPPTLTVYENVHAAHPLPFEQLAPYATVKRVEIEEVNPRPLSK